MKSQSPLVRSPPAANPSSRRMYSARYKDISLRDVRSAVSPFRRAFARVSLFRRRIFWSNRAPQAKTTTHQDRLSSSTHLGSPSPEHEHTLRKPLTRRPHRRAAKLYNHKRLSLYQLSTTYPHQAKSTTTEYDPTYLHRHRLGHTYANNGSRPAALGALGASGARAGAGARCSGLGGAGGRVEMFGPPFRHFGGRSLASHTCVCVCVSPVAAVALVSKYFRRMHAPHCP